MTWGAEEEATIQWMSFLTQKTGWLSLQGGKTTCKEGLCRKIKKSLHIHHDLPVSVTVNKYISVAQKTHCGVFYYSSPSRLIHKKGYIWLSNIVNLLNYTLKILKILNSAIYMYRNKKGFKHHNTNKITPEFFILFCSKSEKKKLSTCICSHKIITPIYFRNTKILFFN